MKTKGFYLLLVITSCLISGCIATRTGLINDHTYFSTDSPNIKVTLPSAFKNTEISGSEIDYTFVNRLDSKVIYIHHELSPPNENAVDYYLEPSTWIFSHIPQSQQISTGTEKILNMTWYYCYSIFFPENKDHCFLNKHLSNFTYQNDIFTIIYSEPLHPYECGNWKDFSELTSDQEKTLSRVNEYFYDAIDISTYSPAE